MTAGRGLLADLLVKLGGAAFNSFSRCEDKGVFKETFHWLKLTLLGFLVILISPLSVKTLKASMCYVGTPNSEVGITDVTLSPNPTNGVDSVTLRATAKVLPKFTNTHFVSEASFLSPPYTDWLPMEAVDDTFNDTLELIEARFYVGDLPPETTLVFIMAETQPYSFYMAFTKLVVSSPDTSATQEQEPEAQDD